jgi:hypothetical protein
MNFVHDTTNSITARPVTCRDVDDVCATNTILGAFGCCESTALYDCTLATACVPFASLPYCDAACEADPYVTLCDSTDPYCQYDIFVFPQTELTYFGCAPSQIVVTVLPTYSGGSVTATFTPFVISSTPTVAIPSSLTSIAVSSGTPSTTGSTTSASPQPPPPTSPTSTSKPAPAGAIAGGVVGGLAVVGAFGFGIFYLLSRRRRGNAPAPNVPVGGPPPMDPKSPMSTYVGPVENVVAGGVTGATTTSPMGGPQAEYYAPPGAAAGTLAEKRMSTSTTPYQSPQPQYLHMTHGPDGMPASGLLPQLQHAPAISPPMSPAPSYKADPNRISNIPAHDGSMMPPMGDSNMIDGRQVWPTGPGVHEAPGSVPGQPSGHY